MSDSPSLLQSISIIPDHRSDRSIYPLENILCMTICAVIAGADDFVAIARFANTKKDFFAKFLDLSQGIPSHDRFNTIFKHLDPEAFQNALLNWITSLHKVTAGQIIAIDGKTLRRSYDKADCRSAIHMVSAWASVNHISLGQKVVDAKSNEITAIPELLRLIDVAGALVTIDAMGCQTEIAKTVIEQNANYCLAVKGNQPTLHHGIEAFFDERIETDFEGVEVRSYETNEKGHGRVDSRVYHLCEVPVDLPDRDRWEGIAAIGMATINSERDGKEQVGIRYYILSEFVTAERFAEAVRGHWSVENNLHWQLDVTFSEDQCRVRHGHADENLSTVRRTALSLLKNEKTAKIGVKNKRLNAGWDDDYLAKVLFAN